MSESRSTLRREALMKGEQMPEFDQVATTPAYPTDQIATVAAKAAVVQDAQQYDWGYDEGNGDEACFTLTSDDGLNKRTEVMAFGDTARYLFDLILQRDSYAAYIERLEAEMEDALAYVARVEAINEKVIAERDALLAEHEVYPFLNRTAWQSAYDNAEKVIRGE